MNASLFAGRPSEGNAWRHPVRFFRRNGLSLQTLVDAMDWNPVTNDVIGFDAVILGANPILGCLLAKYLGDRGQRVLLGLHDMPDSWAYEVLETPVGLRLLGEQVDADPAFCLHEIVVKLAQEAGVAIARNAGYVLQKGCAPAGLKRDFDGAYCGYVRRPEGGGSVGGLQASLTSIARSNLLRHARGLSHFGALHRQRAFIAPQVYVTSFDSGMTIASEADGESRLQVRYGAEFDEVVKLGSAVGFVGEGAPWLRRVIADLVAMRNLCRKGEVVAAEKYYF